MWKLSPHESPWATRIKTNDGTMKTCGFNTSPIWKKTQEFHVTYYEFTWRWMKKIVEMHVKPTIRWGNSMFPCSNNTVFFLQSLAKISHQGNMKIWFHWGGWRSGTMIFWKLLGRSVVFFDESTVLRNPATKTWKKGCTWLGKEQWIQCEDSVHLCYIFILVHPLAAMGILPHQNWEWFLMEPKFDMRHAFRWWLGHPLLHHSLT